MSRRENHLYEFGPFRLDTQERLLLREGRPVQLTPKVFDILVVLVRQSGHLVEKDELMQLVWPDTVVEEGNLTRNVSTLRKALSDDQNGSMFIETVPRVGYRFVAGVKELPATGVGLVYRERTSITVEEEESETDGETRRRGDAEKEIRSSSERKSVRRIIIAVSVLCVLLVAGLLVALTAGGFRLWRDNSRTANHDRATADPLAQTTVRQLTANGNIRSAVISPDGKFYAFTVAEREGSKYSLWLGQIDGSNEIQLRRAEDVFYNGLAFSTDSKTLYYSSGRNRGRWGTLFRIPVLGGVPEKILPRVGNFLSISPDNQHIAFFGPSKDHSASAVLVARLDGTGERELLTRRGDKQFASFTPAWSPDGSMLAVDAASEDGNTEVFVVKVAEGTIKQLTSVAWNEIVSLVWQHDSQGLIAVAKEKGAILNQLWRIGYPSGDARRVSLDQDTYGSAISVSADSNSLLAVQGRPESNIWVGPADNPAQAQQITFGSIGAVYGWNGLDWTPEGKILFTGLKNQSRVIYEADRNGGNLRQLTPASSFDQKLSVTTNGRFIVFQSDRSGYREIWRANSDGSDLRQITTGGGNSFPHTTPDGRWIVYASDRENKSAIWRIPLAGGEPARLTSNDSAYPRVSPDGKFIACTYRVDEKHPAQIALLPAEGGAPVKLFDLPSSAAFQDGIRWTPDGQAFCYRDRENGIWKQNIEGGEPQRVARLPNGRIFSYGWSRDGKLLAFSTGAESRDVVLISLFR